MAKKIRLRPRTKITVCDNVHDVVMELGGTHAVAPLTKCGVTAVHNWLARGSFPPRHYLKMQSALIERNAVAHPRLWGQDGETHYEIAA